MAGGPGPVAWVASWRQPARTPPGSSGSVEVAMDLGLFQFGLAFGHGWISWWLRRLPPTLLLRPAAWGPASVLE